METKNNRTSDEIDLLYFFNPLIRVFKNLQRAFTGYVETLQRRRLFFLFIFFTIALIGFLLRYFIPKYYKTNAIFISYNLPSDFCSIMIGNLQTLTGNSSNTSILAQQLKIPENTAADIHSISAQSLDSFFVIDENDSTNNAGSAFRIALVVKSKVNIAEIQNGLQYFLENNEFSLKRKEAKRKTLEALKNNFIVRGKNLDSLRSIVNSFLIPRGTEQGTVLGEPVSPIKVYELQEDYYRQQLDIEEELALLRNIEVLQPFFKRNNSNYPDFNKLFFYSLLIGLLLALLVTPLIGRKT